MTALLTTLVVAELVVLVLLARLGLDNVFGASPDRYPHVEAEQMPDAVWITP